jgi:ABC-type uncharacterized transport system involved in gliding motility auxiliary subunit
MKDFKKNFITTFVIGAVLLAMIIVLVNMIFDNINFGRFDFTSGQVYSISPATETILSNLEAPISVTYYVSSSEKMPTKWKNLERDVIDILKELKFASKGKLDYTVFDPSVEEEKEAVEEEKEAIADAAQKDEKAVAAQKQKETKKKIAQKLYEKGVIPFGVQSTERDEFAVKRVYSSLVLSYLDRKEDVIPEVRPETFGSLEYEIVSRIFKLNSNKRPKVAFYPSQPEIPPYMRQQYMMRQQEPPDFYEMPVQLLKEAGYDVVRTNIKKEEPIPEDITTLIVMVDQPINQRQQYEIEKAVHRGVNLVLAAQSYNFNISGGASPNKFQVIPQSSRLNVNSMTRNWGFEFDTKIFMDRFAGIIQVPVYQMRNMGMFQVQEQRFEPVSKPVLIRVAETNINSEVSISNKIDELFYLYGSKLNLIDDVLESDKVSEKVILFTSSEHSWTRDSNAYGPLNTDEPADESMLRYQPLAIYLEGKFASSFVDRAKPDWPIDPQSGEPTAAVPDTTREALGEVRPGKIIALGCANLFKSQLLQNFTSHRALLLNSVDALSLGEDLIKIRSKNISVRRIRPTTMTEKFWSKVFVIWFMPLVFVVLGIYLALTRTKLVKDKIHTLKIK